MLNTYEEFQDHQSTEKITLAVIEPARRVIGFTLHSGSIYKLTNFDVSIIAMIEDSGVDLVEVGSIGAIVAGSFYNDRSSKILYLRTLDSVNPNSKFLVMRFKQFFSSVPFTGPYDLNTGKEVDWLPYVLSTSEFGVEIDNKNQLGFAIEGSGSINFINETSYWSPNFDKWSWENKPVLIYSYHRQLPITESKIIYRGFIQKKSWSNTKISFSLKDIITELKQPLDLANLGDYPSASIPENLKLAKQRRVYGYVYGHVPSPLDNIVTGFTGTGTMDVTFGSEIITGVGTSFLSELSPNDSLIIQGDTEEYTVDAIQSNTQLTLSEPWNEGTRTGRAFTIKTNEAKHYKNRDFLVAGHATREPSTTVTLSISLNYIEVASDLDLLVGDKLQIGLEFVTIKRVNSNRIKLNENLVSLPAIGSVVTRLSVSDVYIGGDIVQEQDYSYDANTGVLTFTEEAEFNIARVQPLIGTSITITNTLRTVTGVGTKFTSQLKSGDWIRTKDQEEYFEILQVVDDTNLELRTPATYTETQTGFYKSPNYINDSSPVVSVDCLGRTDDGTKTGVFLKTASQIIEDVLTEIGIGSVLDLPAFTTSKELAPQLIGRVLPVKVSDKTTQTIRDFVGDVAESVFGSVIQTPDFEIAFNILEPTRTLEDKKLEEVDTLGFNINTDGSKIAKTCKVNYLFKEFDYLALSGTNLQLEHTPDENNYLMDSKLVETFDSKLVKESDAEIMAQRFAFLLQLAKSTVSLDTKLQGSRLSVSDRVWFKHEKIYERIGTNLSQKVGAVESIKKSGTNVSVEFDDLSGAFSRCSTVTENTADEYNNATNNEKIINGFITDNYGMIDNESDTFSINLIW